MKLRKVAKLCTDSGSVQLIDLKHGQQWVGNDQAIYFAYGLPYMEEGHVPRVFDFSIKQKDNTVVEWITADDSPYDFSDNTTKETPLERSEMSILWNGLEYIPFLSANQLMYVDNLLLEALSSVVQDQRYYLRHTESGSPYLAVKNGLFLEAVMIPGRLTEKMTNEIGLLAGFTRNSFYTTENSRLTVV